MTEPTNEFATALDAAQAAIGAAPEDEKLQLNFYECLADSMLFLMLVDEGDADRIVPRLFDLESGPVALAFDREERLADFAEDVSAYIALPGRAIMQILRGQGIGLGVNFGSPSQRLLPPDAVDWLAGLVTGDKKAVVSQPAKFFPPLAQENFLANLARRLQRVADLADEAYLVEALYEDGRRALLLAVSGATEPAEEILSQAAQEALNFAGTDHNAAETLDVMFMTAGEPLLTAMSRIGLRLDLAALRNGARP